ncbi:MAG: YceI family protein [Nanoarchaeota archaeon]
MMKKILMTIVLVVFLAGCTQVPDDVAQAEFTGNSNQQNQGGQSSDGMQETEQMQGDESMPENAVRIDTEASKFEFEGYAPGKSHVGTLNEWEGYMVMDGDAIKKIVATFDMTSVDTGIGALDNHLMSEDFYYTEMHPTSTVETIEIGPQQTTALMDFRGVQQEIIIPTEELSENAFASEFLLNMSNYGIDNPAADEMVRMQFRFVAED